MFVITEKDSDKMGNATFERRAAHIHSSKSVKSINHFLVSRIRSRQCTSGIAILDLAKAR